MLQTIQMVLALLGLADISPPFPNQALDPRPRLTVWHLDMMVMASFKKVDSTVLVVLPQITTIPSVEMEFNSLKTWIQIFIQAESIYSSEWPSISLLGWGPERKRKAFLLRSIIFEHGYVFSVSKSSSWLDPGAEFSTSVSHIFRQSTVR